MKIPAPKATYGEVVLVRNYRMRPAQWEEGTVRAAQYHCRWSSKFSWSYEVGIERANYTLHVGNDGIRTQP